MKILQENKKAISLGLGLIAFGAIIPNLNNFTRFWASHEIAYAAQSDVASLKETIQEAYRQQADYYKQQMQQSQYPVRNYYEEQDERGNWWCCSNYDGRYCLDQWKRC